MVSPCPAKGQEFQPHHVSREGSSRGLGLACGPWKSARRACLGAVNCGVAGDDRRVSVRVWAGEAKRSLRGLTRAAAAACGRSRSALLAPAGASSVGRAAHPHLRVPALGSAHCAAALRGASLVSLTEAPSVKAIFSRLRVPTIPLEVAPARGPPARHQTAKPVPYWGDCPAPVLQSVFDQRVSWERSAPSPRWFAEPLPEARRPCFASLAPPALADPLAHRFPSAVDYLGALPQPALSSAGQSHRAP